MTHTPAELRKMCQQPLKINELTYLGTVASKHIPALLDEVERYREALEFYADETKYFGTITDKPGGGTLMEWPMYQDGGQRARAALQPDLMGEKE